MSDFKEGMKFKGCPHCGFEEVLSLDINCCPEKIASPMFPSANSSLPPEELEEVNECIDVANELLLSLGLVIEEENLRSLQLRIRELRGLCLNVDVQCGEHIMTVTGILEDAGLDFIILETNVKNLKIIPTDRIVTIQHMDKGSKKFNLDQELLCTDETVRRSLMLRFSEVVSRSPYLLNLFFGIRLSLFLESYVGCWVYIAYDEAQREIEGTLLDVGKQNLIIKNNDDEKQGFDFDELCYIEIEKEAFSGLRLF